MRTFLPILNWYIILAISLLFTAGCVRQKDGATFEGKVLHPLAKNPSLDFLAKLKVINSVVAELRGWNFYLKGTVSPELVEFVKSSDDWVEISGDWKDFFTEKLPWWKPDELGQYYIFPGNASELGISTGLQEKGIVSVIVGTSEKENPKEAIVYLKVALPMPPL